MGWNLVRDRRKLVRASKATGCQLAALWEYEPDHPADRGMHTRAFLAVNGSTGYLYTDGYVDWDDRPYGPWAD